MISQTHTMISTADWGAKDGDNNYKILLKSVVKLFEDLGHGYGPVVTRVCGKTLLASRLVESGSDVFGGSDGPRNGGSDSDSDSG